MTDTTTDKGLVERLRIMGQRFSISYEERDLLHEVDRYIAALEARLSRVTAPVDGMGLETTEIERSEWFENLDLSPVVGIDNSDSRRLLRDFESLSARLRVAEEALEPFANAVFNDNGDVTFDHTTYSSDDLWKAYSVLRRAASIRARGES